MMILSLSEIARMVDGRLEGPDGVAEGVSIDTRSLQHGQLFVALAGAHHDGHAFVEDALPAAGVMVSRTLSTSLGQVVVDDTRLALGRLARAWRRELPVTVIALTGSNGKTTVKEMLAAIAREHGPVLATRGNLNNDIGVPLTLLELARNHRHAVVEMGANHAGEIAYLTDLAKPDVALITNAGPAHLEGFGSIEGVARAKGEIFRGLSRTGTAVINADDPYAEYWRSLNTGHRIITFGLEQPADITGTWTAPAHLAIRLGDTDHHLSLAFPGRHNAMNALAAAAAATAADIPVGAILRGLMRVHPVSGRLTPRPGLDGALLLDDSYNANPASTLAALDVLAASPGERCLVLGDMGELGDEAEQLHAHVGRRARELGIEHLLATGPLTAHAVQAYGEGARHFGECAALIDALRPMLNPSMTVLVKGSRSQRMERVVQALQAGNHHKNHDAGGATHAAESR
ncbi:UDP-N-acetylmuramoyl-tripeptide--D-alanyl-D-alanine ligase [Thioalkalivibrio denitrificans]|uniref:UDP-N-acetylmuramoyl-tripeptide--D-alanyl-D-alanine ligase n=1 Tax=Thioalkalivibrio denitrificans TaxID=108003 RepID=A0A1V3NN45_9GAMM|nr:UDP-N-acetylmuramoyl-tripeptide--D-alanyl-D-alanine ligase [Thioalkalivibrio denitrificans]OOG26461.1 UDP-N-acetylmuramoyl-tripeptide--D-alanyl-D-alanine ligase [Thioalkalivibrio denitrificans]